MQKGVSNIWMSEGDYRDLLRAFGMSREEINACVEKVKRNQAMDERIQSSWSTSKEKRNEK